MLTLPASVRIDVAAEAVDLRRGFWDRTGYWLLYKRLPGLRPHPRGGGLHPPLGEE
jgi:hypothetical protein